MIETMEDVLKRAATALSQFTPKGPWPVTGAQQSGIKGIGVEQTNPVEPSELGDSHAPLTASVRRKSKTVSNVPKMFVSPKGSAFREHLAYPAPSLTINKLLTDEGQLCLAYLSHVSGASLQLIMTKAVMEHYDNNVDWMADQYDETKRNAA
jgi:hypothetical protein